MSSRSRATRLTLIYPGAPRRGVTQGPSTWIVLPFRGIFVERTLVPAFQDALFGGRVERLSALVAAHTFASEELQQDAQVRATRLTEQALGGAIDYVGEGPYPAGWRMDANRGVFHYAGNSPWCFDAYKLLLDMGVVDPPPPGWAREFPEADAGSFDAGGTLWDFFGDLSNESYDLDSGMAKLFDSLPVWLSPSESTFTGFLDEADVKKVRGLIEALGEGRRQRSFNMRAFFDYLARAQELGLGLTAAAVPAGTRWQDERPRNIAEHW